MIIVLSHDELSATERKTITYETMNSVESLFVVSRTRHSKNVEIETKSRNTISGKISVILSGRRILEVTIHERIAQI
jgi:hypothetical protein